MKYLLVIILLTLSSCVEVVRENSSGTVLSEILENESSQDSPNLILEFPTPTQDNKDNVKSKDSYPKTSDKFEVISIKIDGNIITKFKNISIVEDTVSFLILDKSSFKIIGKLLPFYKRVEDTKILSFKHDWELISDSEYLYQNTLVNYSLVSTSLKNYHKFVVEFNNWNNLDESINDFKVEELTYQYIEDRGIDE